MTGQDAYNNNYERLMTNAISSAPEKYRKVLKGFLNHLRDAFSVSTKYGYFQIIKRFVISIDKDEKEIDYEDYTEFLNSVATKSSTYKIMTYAALKLFSEYMLASGKAERNIMEHIKAPKTSKSANEEKREKRLNNVLHEEEIKQYIRNVECGCGSSRAKAYQENWKERDRCIIELFLTTGMRCSAMYKLSIADVDLLEGTIKTLEKRDKKRIFYLSDNTRMALEEWLIRRDELLNGKEEDALFISNRKRRLDTSCIAAITKKYGEGIKNTSPHKLRATFGTQLLEKTNGDIDKVRIAMGHNSVSTTELYMRRDESKVGKEVAELMSNII